MNIVQTSQHLASVDQPFDIIIIKPNGDEQAVYQNIKPKEVNIEERLNQTIANFKPKSIKILPRKRNGSTNIKQWNDVFVVDFSPSMQGLSGLDNQTHSLPASTDPMGAVKDFMIGELTSKNTKLEQQNQRLESDNERLKRENFDFEKEIKFKDAEHELEIRRGEVEQSNGLGGVLEKVSANPVAMSTVMMLASRIMGVDPAAMAQLPGAAESGSEAEISLDGVEGSEFYQQAITEIQTWLVEQSDDVIAMYFALTNAIATSQNPQGLLENLTKKIKK